MSTLSGPSLRHTRAILAYFTVILLSVSLLCSAERDGDTTAVIETVQSFFDALALKDSASAKQVMLQDGMLQSIRVTESGPLIRSQHFQTFFKRISEETRDLLERMRKPTVLVQGRTAMLWAAYDFYIDGSYSHCGTDVFSLLKTDTGWKIAGIIYSVETRDCPDTPPNPPGTPGTSEGN